ncbi:MAG: MliC family protein [Rhodocyclaceae bacterium]|nr:MliC family protein [Rhodocyclaceae bacterium]MCA3089786.1 MliC family protein [Rhodocyclaceae bacterium]MCA3094627.1 MliC family protein [Rhodocyclaceae bacterium]MCA3098275.1 MliC family protein [Rhodocyclaceae bacterium]MCA3100943.1 MliC family protein [Rhodocyclaceae bacterium]
MHTVREDTAATVAAAVAVATAPAAAPRTRRHRLLLPALLLVIAATLSGCRWLRPGPAAVQPPAAAAGPATAAPAGMQPRLLAEGWRCEDGQTLGTRALAGLKTVELRIGEVRRTLPQAASASGVRFEDADWLFWQRGAQAMLQRKPAPPVYCNEVRALSLVEDARARGITFRGQGSAPGWLLEVGPDNRVVLSGPAGSRDIEGRHEWPDLTAAPGPAYGSTRYTAEAGGRRHVIVVLPDPCVDDISGERFPAAVLIEVDGRRLRGCGTPIAH